MAKRIKIILDTNWYVSATINKNSRRILYKILTDKRIGILYCETILYEYRDVISRNKFSKFISPQQAFRLIDLIMPQLEKVQLKTLVEESRDADDNYLLSLAVDGSADYLITGDLDLLVLEEIGKTKIIRLNVFLEILSR